MQTNLPHPTVDFFRSNHRVYYIASGEFIQQSLGLRVPFFLCHILNELGYEAYVTARKSAPNLRTPLLNSNIIEKHKADGREIVVVYTDSMWGNILGGDIVVHWIMNAAGLIKESILGEEELLFFWDESYSLKDKKSIKLLRFPVIDESIFHFIDADDKNRNGFAYYANKYLMVGEDEIPDIMKENGISLCQDIKRTPQEIADVLRSVKVFYTYEDTALIIEAALCGCIIVFVKTKYTLYSCGNSKPEEMYDYCVDEELLDVNTSYRYNGVVRRNYKERFIDSAGGNLTDFINITQTAPLKPVPLRPSSKRHSAEGKRVFLYGAGRTGHMISIYLNAIDIKVEGFVVSDKYIKNYNETLWGIPVHTFTWYKEQKDNNCFLVLTMERANEEGVSRELDMNGEKYTRYKDAFDFRSDFNSVMTSLIQQLVERNKEMYLYGSGIYTDVIFNTLCTAGVNIFGLIVPDQCVDESGECHEGLPVISHSVFVKSAVTKKRGVIVSMQYGFILEVLDELSNIDVDYVITVF